MIVYTGILFGLAWGELLMQIAGRKEQAALSSIISICISLPIYGRIFGWW